MEAPPEAKGGFRQGPSWLSPWTLGGHSPFSNSTCILWILLRLTGDLQWQCGAPREVGIKPCTPAQVWPLCTQDTALGNSWSQGEQSWGTDRLGQRLLLILHPQHLQGLCSFQPLGHSQGDVFLLLNPSSLLGPAPAESPEDLSPSQLLFQPNW